ncbi:hypothetical protein [Pedobacter kyonggii]|nr:hypothetical protein [Pedobacter kyonggii]
MKQKPLRLTKKTVFVFRSQKGKGASSTDPTETSVIIIATETIRTGA